MVNSNPSYYDRKKIGTDTTVFKFDSLNDYFRFIEETSRVATGNARQGIDRITNQAYINSQAKDKSWYGTTDVQSITGNLDTYLFNNDLDSFLTKFRSQSVNTDVTDIDQQKAIKFTDQEIGIFSFDLASLGLIRVYEFYSPLLKKVVSSNLVESKKLPNGDIIFYHVYQPFIPEHKIEYSLKTGGYFSNILNRNVPKESLFEVVTGTDIYLAYPETQEIPEHNVERRQQVDENGRLKFSSTFKKSFIEIPKIEKRLPRVDIIITMSPSSVINAGTQMIYASMAGITLAEKLMAANVDFRIIACYSLETSGNAPRRKVLQFVTIKKETEPFDKNKLSILLSDGRFVRGKTFIGDFASQYDAGYDANISVYGIGSPFNDANAIKQKYMDYLSMSTNPLDVEASKNPRSKIVLAGAFSEKDAIRQYNETIDQIKRL